MAEPQQARTGHRVEVSVQDFRQRMQQLADGRAGVYAQLALVHQVAKAFAQEAAGSLGPEVEIDEITNPPLDQQDDEDEPVLIQFSYPADAS